MPSRPKSTETPPPPPAPETRLGHNPAPPPDYENDRALRFTWLRLFDDSEKLAPLEGVLEWLLDAARNSNAWGGTSFADDIAAAREDVESLWMWFSMFAEMLLDDEDAEQRRLGERAEAWAARLGALARDIRRETGDSPETADSLAHARAGGALDDLESAQAQLLAIFDPGIPAELRGPVGAALGRVAEAVAILRSVVPATPEGDGE